MAVKSNFLSMALSLGTITLVCAALLGWIYTMTESEIKASAMARTREAIASVSPSFDKLIAARTADGTTYNIAVGPQGDTVGFVINASSSGFGGKLSLMVGFRPDGTIYDTAVLEHSETPGLGAKCAEKGGFVEQFKGFNPSLKKLSVKKDGGDVDAITASTITSRAYCVALENAVKIMEELKHE